MESTAYYFYKYSYIGFSYKISRRKSVAFQIILNHSLPGSARYRRQRIVELKAEKPRIFPDHSS